MADQSERLRDIRLNIEHERDHHLALHGSPHPYAAAALAALANGDTEHPSYDGVLAGRFIPAAFLAISANPKP